MSKTKLYSLTPEHRAQLRPWAERWIANALSTKPMDDGDRTAMIDAVNGMYDAANLPRPKNIVFVPSPLVGRVAAGFAAAIWYDRKNATDSATEAATEAATSAATYAATIAATEAATSAATSAATTLEVGWAFNLSIKIGGKRLSALMCACARSSWRFCNAGNMWSGWTAYLSFFRHVAKLDLPIYDKFKHYEAATIHGGYRWMHPDFCMISDRPRVLKIDESNRPHCADGPSHLWSDGFSIFHWHGYRIPDTHTWIITDKDRITAEAIMAEPNAELRRIMCEITAFEPIRSIARVTAQDVDGNGHPRRLMTAEIGGEQIRIVEVLNGSLEPDGSRRQFLLGAMPGRTPREVIAASYGIAPKHYYEAVRT